MRNIFLVFISAFLLALAVMLPAKPETFNTLENLPKLLDHSPFYVDQVLGKPDMRKRQEGSANTLSLYNIEVDGHFTKTLVMSRRDNVVGIAVTYLVVDGVYPETKWVSVEDGVFVEFGEENGVMHLVFDFPTYLKVIGVVPSVKKVVEKPTLRELLDTNFKLMGVKFITKNLNPELRG